MLKKVVSVLLAVILMAAVQVQAAAQTWEGEGFSFWAPDDMYALSLNTSPDDPVWALLGIGDVNDRLKEYSDMGVLVNFVSKDGKTSVNVMRKDSDMVANVFNLQTLTEEEKQSFMDTQLPSANTEDETMQTSVEKGWVNAEDNLFYRVKIDAVINEAEVHELIYGTIVNGFGLNFDIVSRERDFTEEETAIMDLMAASLKFDEILEKPEPDPISLWGTAFLLVLLVAALVVPFVVFPIRSKQEKKHKAKLAEQLSEYHKTHAPDTVEGEAMFINSTDCTKEAIHHFAYFQAYQKDIGGLVFGVIMCIAMLAAAFIVDTEWWMKLVAVAVAGYYVYKIIVTPSNLEKIQRKVYGRGPSQTAHYSFYPGAFRVSGIQSASVIPYFQITDVRRSGQYLYLYYGPENAYMVDQYGFVMGDFEEFVKFIAEKTKKEK